jgi:stage V sporulation protein AB
LIKAIITVLVSAAGGLAVGTSVSAFFTVLGVPVKIIQWSRKTEYMLLYHICMVLGAVVSCLIYFLDFNVTSLKLPPMKILAVPVGLIIGMFLGMLAAALTETLDIISGAAKQLKILKWIYLIVVVVILGKMAGSLLFFLIPGFY